LAAGKKRGFCLLRHLKPARHFSGHYSVGRGQKA